MNHLSDCRTGMESDCGLSDWVVTRSSVKDISAIQQYYANLTDTSLHMRFHSSVRNVPFKFVQRYANQEKGICQALVLKSPAGDVAGEAMIGASEVASQVELGVSVLDTLRGNGFGSRLVLKSVELARVSGFQRLVADTLRENKRFVTFMQRLGFVVSKHPLDWSQIQLCIEL